MTLTSQRMDAFLSAAGAGATTGTNNASLAGAGAGRVEKIVAEGDVTITQNARKATGGQLVYTVAEDQFVLTGGPPSIFDAEHGKITGNSLTFYKRDDRVLVEGSDSSPTSTTIRVAR